MVGEPEHRVGVTVRGKEEVAGRRKRVEGTRSTCHSKEVAGMRAQESRGRVGIWEVEVEP